MSMCNANGETINLLLLHCSVAYGLWDTVFSMFGVQCVLPRQVLDLLAYWRGWFGRH
jgi:hypothetical protein